jgi:phenylalanyl-tRNA synthetase beta chain
VPPVIYTTVPPDGIKFVPLDFEEEMTPAEILERHP